MEFKKAQKNIILKTVGFYINVLSYLAPKKALAVAYKLFTNPRKGKLNKKHIPAFLKTAQQDKHLVFEHRFKTYTWKGNNQTILLAHGWQSNAARWEKLLPILQQTQKTIVAIDAPAHGLSTSKEFNVPTYAEYLQVVIRKINPQIIIGHSIGGTACIYNQYKYENVSTKKLILLGTPSEFNTLLDNYRNMLGFNPAVAKMMKRYIKKRFGFETDEFSAALFAQKISIPTLVAHDVFDNVIPISEAELLTKSLKNSTFIKTQNLGHSMHDVDLYNQILQFIEA